MAPRQQTALGTARDRFVDGLPRKADELVTSLASLTDNPESSRPREELRRRLHALYASAQVFRLSKLAAMLKEAIQRLDAAKDSGRALDSADLDVLRHVGPALRAAADGEEQAAGDGPSESRGTQNDPHTEVSPEHALGDPSSPMGESQAMGSEVSEHDRAVLGAVALKRVMVKRPVRVAVEQTDEPVIALTRRRSSRPPGEESPGRPSSRPAPPYAPLDTVMSVLVLSGVEGQARVRAALPGESFEVVVSSDPEKALRLARATAPDVVVAERDLVQRPGVDFLARLRADPLTGFVPLVLMLKSGTANDLIAVREEGADETIGESFESDALIRTLHRVTRRSGADGGNYGGLGDMTVEEVAARLAEEIHRGLADTAEQGRDVKVPMGDGAEILAAAWTAIGRVRATMALRSGGRVRFRDKIARGAPAVMALMADHHAEDAASVQVSLNGRKVIVADDDPAVLWFFAGLLREEGADVFEAANGREALDEARKHRPDVIISDILMPEMDGFALCRALEREPELSEVPVILISWKEDFIERMRELKAGASGYLRKEAGSAQILSGVRAVLRPRARLEAELSTGGEVRGRVEGVGIITLLRTVATTCGDARVSVRDAWNLFEVDIRDGTVVDLTRTATDGSFARGERALLQLLGVNSGRFTAAPSRISVRPSIDGPLDTVIANGADRLAALLHTVTGSGMRTAVRVELSDDVLGPFVETSPEPIRMIVRRLQGGEGPAHLVQDERLEPRVVEAALVDLVRRGAITGVRGAAGDDLLARALARRADPGAGVTTATEASRGSVADLDVPFTENLDEPSEPSSPPLAPDLRVPALLTPAPRLAQRELMEPPPAGRAEPIEAREREEYDAETEVEDLDELESVVVEVAPVRRQQPKTEPPTPPPEARSHRPRRPRPDRRRLAPTVPMDRRPIAPRLAWPVVLLAFAVAGFLGVRAYESLSVSTEGQAVPGAGSGASETTPRAPTEEPAGPGQAAASLPAESPAPDVSASQREKGPGAEPRVAVEERLTFGQTAPLLDAGPSVAVPPDHGLLVVQGEGASVHVGPRELGTAPLRTALPEGRHELVFRRGGQVRYRYVFIRSGQTRIVDAP